MNFAASLTPKSDRAMVMGLLVACPFGKALDSCPAKDLRSLPLRKRHQLVQHMTASLDDIIAIHRRCLVEREGA